MSFGGRLLSARRIAESDYHTYTKRAKYFRSQQGFVVAALLVAVLGATLSGAIVDRSVAYFSDTTARAQQKTDENIRNAKDALLNYMLLRVENPIKIRSGNSSQDARFLMPPCPDNIGDEDLDGTQDPVCGSDSGSGTNVVNDILNSGSRFGRLPWGAGLAETLGGVSTVYDGLGGDFYDAWGNRLWYALSRNMAPAGNSGNIPLNLHRLATKKEEWLSVVNQHGATLNAQVAAVILAPGNARQRRLGEGGAVENVYAYPHDVTGASSILNPKNYFEDYTIIENTSLTIMINANHDKDGIFVDALSNNDNGFNDTLEYVTLDELMNPSGFFFPTYRRLVGISEIHNQPFADRPLAYVRDALSAYYNLFDFYPEIRVRKKTTSLNRKKGEVSLLWAGEVR